jgi:hypothetical protein
VQSRITVLQISDQRDGFFRDFESPFVSILNFAPILFLESVRSCMARRVILQSCKHYGIVNFQSLECHGLREGFSGPFFGSHGCEGCAS